MEQRLITLARLPWFKRDRIPDYLRRDLLSQCDSKTLEKIGGLYREIFQQTESVQQDSSASKTTSPAEELTIMADSHYKLTRHLKDLIRFSKPGSVYKDELFVKVLFSGQRSLLDFLVPETLRLKLNIYRHPIWPVVMLLLLVFAGYGLAQQGWRHLFEDQVK